MSMHLTVTLVVGITSSFHMLFCLAPPDRWSLYTSISKSTMVSTVTFGVISTSPIWSIRRSGTFYYISSRIIIHVSDRQRCYQNNPTINIKLTTKNVPNFQRFVPCILIVRVSPFFLWVKGLSLFLTRRSSHVDASVSFNHKNRILSC